MRSNIRKVSHSVETALPHTRKLHEGIQEVWAALIDSMHCTAYAISLAMKLSEGFFFITVLELACYLYSAQSAQSRFQKG